MRQWQTTTLLAIASVVVGLALCELGLRCLGIEYPNFYEYDPQFGGKLRPGLQGYWLKEGGGYVSINSEGLRDREHPISHPPNTLRIAVLGDSFAEAMQVNRDEAFWSVLERELQGHPKLQGCQVEVINFGQAGFGITQELLAFRHRVRKYTPDLVLLAFFTGNDIADSSKALKHRDYHPYMIYQGKELVLDDRATKEKWLAEQRKKTWWSEFYRWRFDNLRIEQVFHHCREVAQIHWAAKKTGKDASAFGLYDTIYREPTEEVWKEAWRVTEGVLLLLRDEVVGTGARFMVVVLTNDMQVQPLPATRAEFARRLGVVDLFYPDRRVEEMCQRARIPILLLAPSFQEYATRNQVFLHGFRGSLGFDHWNQKGHRLAGQRLAEWLVPQLSPAVY
jgi:hypothetical protein